MSEFEKTLTMFISIVLFLVFVFLSYGFLLKLEKDNVDEEDKWRT